MLTKSYCPCRRVQDDGRRPQYCFSVRCTWEVVSSSSGMADVGACHTVLPCSPGTVNTGAHNTVDASEARGRALPYLSGRGVDGAHNTVGENVSTYNTASVLPCHAGRRVLFGRCAGYCLADPWYCGLTCVPCLTFSICFLVLTERVSPVGRSQSALIAPVGEEL